VVPQRVGILGGTFNPPHRGHVAVASCALAQLRLDRVVLMPSHTPPHKYAQEDPGPTQRLRMCELAVAAHAGLSACALEVQRGGASYTVDTLLSLHDLHPNIQPTLILGSDVASTLPTWRSPQRLLALARLAVAERAGDSRAEVLAAVASLHAAPAPASDPAGLPASPVAPEVVFLEMPRVDVSSSMVRQRAAQGGDLDGLVGSAVAAYIAQQRLYRTVAGGRGGALGAAAP
jgi:nicotinate-nucleotide adenylyltransferase